MKNPSGRIFRTEGSKHGFLFRALAGHGASQDFYFARYPVGEQARIFISLCAPACKQARIFISRTPHRCPQPGKLNMYNLQVCGVWKASQDFYFARAVPSEQARIFISRELRPASKPGFLFRAWDSRKASQDFYFAFEIKILPGRNKNPGLPGSLLGIVICTWG